MEWFLLALTVIGCGTPLTLIYIEYRKLDRALREMREPSITLEGLKAYHLKRWLEKLESARIKSSPWNEIGEK